jgi:ATP-dependent exoDNAse (exonuclease V) alpha subunit
MTQDQAFEILKSGHNIFLTGGAGSGKTFLLDRFIKHLKKNKIPVAVTASTGIAATHLDGMTIHSWAGMGIAKEFDSAQLKKNAKKPKVRERIRKSQVLIIDEISMLDAARLDLLNDICKSIKDPFLPFGGLQVVFCGDFFQLPPVSGRGDESFFAFRAVSWQDNDIKVCYLTEQYRHNDSLFSEVLEKIRSGLVGIEEVNILKGRIGQKIDSFNKPTKLFTHNVDVDFINEQELSSLNGKERKYFMSSAGQKTIVETLKKNCLALEKLKLKKGTLVMFVKNNFEEGYVNGTLGMVVGFDQEDMPIVQTKKGDEILVRPEKWNFEEDGKIMASIRQLPLRLAWAITVHKSQGMSLDAAEIDLSKSFADGMGYVALSRVRGLSGLSLIGMNNQALKISEEVLAQDVEFRVASDNFLDNYK